MLYSGSQLDDSALLAFEKKLNVVLPKDYKEFMLKHNGGKPETEWIFDFTDVNNIYNKSIIQGFLVIYPSETHNLDDLMKSYRILVEGGYTPASVLPIADDPSGNIILMSIAGEDYGRVYFGDHELADPDTGYLVASAISNSFAEFVEKCKGADEN